MEHLEHPGASSLGTDILHAEHDQVEYGWRKVGAEEAELRGF